MVGRISSDGLKSLFHAWRKAGKQNEVVEREATKLIGLLQRNPGSRGTSE